MEPQEPKPREETETAPVFFFGFLLATFIVSLIAMMFGGGPDVPHD